MKCPYRKATIHQPERIDGYHKKFAKDIEEFADCHEGECPYYAEKRCRRAEVDLLRGGVRWQ